MKIAVTGGTGFIGRHLVNALIAKGNTVRVLTRDESADNNRKIGFVNGDLLDSRLSFDAFFDGIDIVYHCAGVLQKNPHLFDINVKATQKLLDTASGKIRHWVQLSSIGVYGKYKDGIVTEGNRINPSNIYELSKAKADQLLIEKAETGKFTYSILRPSTVYGNDMTNQSLFNMIDTINKNLFFYFGNQNAIFNYIHVDNVVEALLLCGGKSKAINQIFNISDHEKLENIVNTIAQTINKKKPVLKISERILRILSALASNWNKWPLTPSRIDAMTSSVIYSNERIERELKYKHKISIEDGFKELAHFWQTLNPQ